MYTILWQIYSGCYVQKFVCKFNQEHRYKILSESAGFCGRRDENILVCFLAHNFTV